MTNHEKYDRLVELEQRVLEIDKEDKEMKERQSELLVEANLIRLEVEDIIKSFKP